MKRPPIINMMVQNNIIPLSVATAIRDFDWDGRLDQSKHNHETSLKKERKEVKK